MTQTTQSADPFRGQITQTGKETFEAPKNILKTVPAARAVYEKFRSNHIKRINLYKEIEGLIQGNPPYDPAQLRAAGLQHVSNFNDMSGNATFERAVLSYYNLLYNSQTLTKFSLHVDTPEAPHFAQIMARSWDYAVKKKWPSFFTNVSTLTSQLAKFGVSPAFFNDERDPRWKTIELHRFFVADEAQSDLDSLTNVCIESEFTVQYLWDVYKEFSKKKKTEGPDENNADKALYTPWNTFEVGRLLLQLANSPIKEGTNPSDIFELERKLISGDVSLDKMYSDTVRIVSLFQKEYDGKISHYMFHRNFDDGNFLFYQGNQYKSLREAMVLFTMNPGQFTIHLNRGVGHKIFSLAQAKIMLGCSVVDNAKWASTPILKSPSLSSKDVEQIRFLPGVPTNIGTAEFVQNNLGANLDNVIAATQYLQSQIQYNINYSGADPSQPDPDKGSLAPVQVRNMALNEFSVLKNYVMHFYGGFDAVLQNMTGKMWRSKEGWPGYDLSDCWKKKCIRDGVPEVIFEQDEEYDDEFGLPNHVEVMATRVSGAGSQVALLLGLQELVPIVPSFGPREERVYKRDVITAALGPDAVQEYLQDSDDVDEQAGGASLAGVENAIMQLGKSPIFSPDNESRSHFVTHFALANQIREMITQGQMDVVEADSQLNVLIPHMGQHYQMLSSSPFTQQLAEKFKKPFADLVQFATLNHKNAERSLQSRQEEQQKMAENTQRVMTDEELKTLQVTNEEQRKDEKLQAQSERQERAGAAKEQALARKTDADILIKAKKTGAEIGDQARKTDADLLDQFRKSSKPNGAAKPKSE